MKPRKASSVDLKTVRETIAYIEHDCRDCPQLEGVANALELTLAEIDKAVAAEPAIDEPPALTVRFIPARL